MLEKELAPWQTKIARVEMLRKQLRVAHDQLPADAPAIVQGARFVATLGPRGNQTVIDFIQLVKRINPGAFARFATCTLTALAQNVAPDVAHAVTRVERIGPRPLKILEKGSPV